jgi:hypothetical protein
MAQPISFSANEIKILEDERILLPTSSNVLGKRKVSGSFLTPPASHGSASSSSSSSSSTASISFKHYVLGPNVNLDIPLAEESPDALEFLGFVPEVARHIYDNFSSRPLNEGLEDGGILQWANGHAYSLNTPSLSSLSPYEALTRLGIKESLRDGILDPRFRDVFETQSLLFWVKDSLRINYWTLVGLQGRLKEHVEHVSKRKAKKSKRGSISDVFPEAGSSSSQPSAKISSATSNKHLPKACVVVQEPNPVLDDHVVLYKGKSAAEMVEEFQWIQDDGTLNMMALTSSPFRDFNFGRAAWYFTPEKEIAEKYRKYVERRCENSESWLIQIQVPCAFLNGLTTKSLWYGLEWREYVWHCRTMTMPPSKYDSLWKTGPGSVQVIRGAVCSTVSNRVVKIKKDQIHQLMTEQEVVMKCGNQNANQVAFMQVDVAANLGVAVKGKIHVEVFPPAKTAEE